MSADQVVSADPAVRLAPAAGVPAALDPRLFRLAGPLTTGLLAALDPAELTAAGHETLVIEHPVALGGDGETVGTAEPGPAESGPAESGPGKSGAQEFSTAEFSAGEFSVRFIRLLREALSAGLRVDWALAGPAALDAGLVCHLPPPRDGSELAAAWQAQYGFGRCYYRVGPGFYLLKDIRAGEGGRGVRFRLDDARGVAAFGTLADAVHLPSAAADTVELFGVLEAERLTLRRGDWGTLLPFRMRRWPVPFLAV